MLDICQEYCTEFCLSFNVKKSKVMLFGKVKSNAGVYNVEYSPPPVGGGNKIKWFGDGEENQKLEKKKKENF